MKQEEAGGLRARKKAETRAAIERAAVQLTDERGFKETTVDAICKQANVSRMTFFNYFPSKSAAVLGRSTDFPDADQFVHILEEREGACYLDVLASALEKILVNVADPDLKRARYRILKENPNLLTEEHRSAADVQHNATVALERFLAEHPQARLMPSLSVKEEALLAESSIRYLFRIALIRQARGYTETPFAELRAHVAQYLAKAGNPSADV